MSFNANKLISSFDYIYFDMYPCFTSSSKLAISYVDYYQPKTELIDYKHLKDCQVDWHCSTWSCAWDSYLLLKFQASTLFKSKHLFHPPSQPCYILEQDNMWVHLSPILQGYNTELNNLCCSQAFQMETRKKRKKNNPEEVLLWKHCAE